MVSKDGTSDLLAEPALRELLEKQNYDGRSRLPCEYEEHTADVEENQLIFWTLNCSSTVGYSHSRRPLAVRDFNAAAEITRSVEARASTRSITV